LRRHLEKHHNETAAFIVEPLVQGAAGMAMHHPEYLREARAICNEFRVHLIADEIAVGFGRTGTMFAHEQAGIKPDFLCLSKGISGGYLPLAAVLTTDEVYRAFYRDETAKGFLHSHSYTGNALACRAALAVLDIFEEDGVIAANRAKTEEFSRIAEPLRRHPRVNNFRNTGMIWAFEVEDDKPGFARRCFEEGLKREVLLRPIGNTVYFMPPYVVSAEEMNHLVAATLEILECRA
jgi:adenosylmethionine-8-amino-7-oxononanoate aminotransferase